jgi:hypothetical protein
MERGYACQGTLRDPVSPRLRLWVLTLGAEQVGLLSHNVVIRGVGEGEELSYLQWNVAASNGGGECGNSVCDYLENSKNCPADCRGPAHE